MTRTALILLACTGLAACNPAPPNAGTPTAQGAAMQVKYTDIVTLRSYVAGTTTKSDALQAARDLDAWPPRLAALFPPGSETQYVDLSPEMIQNGPGALAATTGPLLAAVQGGNPPAIGAALARTERDGCGACHRTMPQ
jgi:hypothetical protein